MNRHKFEANAALAKTIIGNLNKRNMEGYYFNSSKDAVSFLLDFIPDDSKVAYGGSMTVKDMGILDLLRKKENISLIDRDMASDAEEKRQLQLASFDSDYYLMSTNAITLDGELVNIDAIGNRVAAMIFGPRNVVIITGINKVEATLKSAVNRVQNFATPANSVRLKCNTPCALTGKCMNCHLDSTLCCQIVVTRHSYIKNRIKVLIVNEELGF